MELAEAKSDLAKAASTLASVRQQYFEQQEELNDDKIALRVLLDEERSAAYDLRHNMKKDKASIAYLNTKLSVLESGARDKEAVRNDLQMKLAAAGNMSKWDAERQQLHDEIARAQREEHRAKQDRDEALERNSISCGGQKEPGTAMKADHRRTRQVPATACSADPRERIRHQSEDNPTVTPQSEMTPQFDARTLTTTIS